MKNVLVTGASGYVGSVLVQLLLDQGYKVTAIDRFYFGDRLPEHERLSKQKLDCRILTADLFTDIDVVIDLVALSNDPSGELFQNITFDINHKARANTAKLAKQRGVRQYILPSSCSIYGYQEAQVDETSETNALTTYAIANERAEADVLALADSSFCVTVLRQATLFGFSPRMRFDLAVNGMALGVFKNGYLPLMRDGTQKRPMLHVKDTSELMCLLLDTPTELINGEIFNVGGNEQNYQLYELADSVCKVAENIFKTKVSIKWYGDPDQRSYEVNFNKIQRVLGWQPKYSISFGVEEIITKLVSGELEDTPDTITLDWYKSLIKWHQIVKQTELNGNILHLDRDSV
ncbi:NAD-dependent epimerase/dehydratase family protein [Pseudoalteromonas piscicida]|uniref:NAD-dependent epimerase/dehydratase family protein n=1 Tax=Pseudoalteromonas piscicida TaxID=43662 RepID=UPI0027E411C0|nr:SDR family oxidoreductase [Pseudoalteromonas piscicida]WMO14132.1 SDR family oxidoreductase [Pseudoalteromonas piscicida]